MRVAIPGLVGALGGYCVVGAFHFRHFILVMSSLDVPCDHEEFLCFMTDLVTKLYLYYGFFTTDSACPLKQNKAIPNCIQSTLGFATMGKVANLYLATRNAVTDLF